MLKYCLRDITLHNRKWFVWVLKNSCLILIITTNFAVKYYWLFSTHLPPSLPPLCITALSHLICLYHIYITASRASICTRSWCCDSGQVHSWSTGQLDCTVQNCSTENGGRNGWRNGWRSITLIHCWSFASLILFSRVFHSFDFAVFFMKFVFMAILIHV